MSKKVVLDLEAVDSKRPSTVNPILLPQNQQDYIQSPSKSITQASNHPFSQMFNRAHILDPNAYSEFKQEFIAEPTWNQVLKGWILLIIAIPLMSLGLLAYKFTDGNPVVAALQISSIFAVVNFGHWILFYRREQEEENQKIQFKSLIQAAVLKIIRAILTAFLVKNVYVSYVSLILGYSSHITLFIIMVKCKFQSYKILFCVIVATMIPISMQFNIIYLILGLIMTGSYLRLQELKQKPLHSGLSWLICGGVLFIVMVLVGFTFQFVYYTNILIALLFVVLSSKLGKQYLLGICRQNYMKQQIIKCSVKLLPLILFSIYQRDMIFLGFLSLGVLGTIMSEYKTQLQDTEDLIIFT